MQLKAHRESTAKIIRAIERSKWIEFIVKLLLVIFQLSYFMYYMFGLLLPLNATFRNATITLSGIVLLLFIHIFCYQILRVNEQLAQLFRMINDETYPYKSVKAIVLLYYAIYLPSNIVNIFWKYWGIDFTYSMLVTLVRYLYDQVFMIMNTLGYLYLADVNFDTKLRSTFESDSGKPDYENINGTF